jgi:hypothetical protein
MVILIVLIAVAVLATVKTLQSTLGAKVDRANAEVAAVTTEGGKEQLQKEKAKQARAEAAAQEKSDQGRAEAAPTGVPGGPDQGGPAPAVAVGAEPEDDTGGFNPFIIPIALGLFGLLGYVIMKSQKG